MRALTKVTLTGGGLIKIDRPETIRRYCACMERLGLEPTKLESFHIDGIGWSPEIADEFHNRDYLSHGIANPVGIIVTANQYDHPIYMPTHSFERVMMRKYFETFHEEIANITTEIGIALDIDQRMTWYRTLDHVCAVHSVRVISDAGQLSETASIQRELINRFMQDDGDAWMDDRLRLDIIESFKQSGKLYDRKLSIGEFTFSDFDDVYTRALGGVYVFRHNGTLALIVIEDESERTKASERIAQHVVAITDSNVVRRIRETEVADIDLEWYRKHPEVLEARLRTLALFILSEDDPDLPVDTLKQAQITGRLQKCSAPCIELYAELEETIARITSGEQVDDLSPDVESMLLHPVLVSSRYEENLVWQLICHVQKWPVDVMRLYSVNKNLFVKRYETWSKPMRAWVRNQIIASYETQKTYEERQE